MAALIKLVIDVVVKLVYFILFWRIFSPPFGFFLCFRSFMIYIYIQLIETLLKFK